MPPGQIYASLLEGLIAAAVGATTADVVADAVDAAVLSKISSTSGV